MASRLSIGRLFSGPISISTRSRSMNIGPFRVSVSGSSLFSGASGMFRNLSVGRSRNLNKGPTSAESARITNPRIRVTKTPGST